MKLAFILGPYSVGSRPLDFNVLWSSSRGLTGSELGILMNAKEMVKLGHDVFFFTAHTGAKPSTWEGIKLFTLEEMSKTIDDSFKAIISYNEPDVFRGLTNKPLRVLCQMLNDFSYVQPGYDEFVDIYTSPCQMHMEHVMKMTPSLEKWRVLALGSDSSWFKDERVPGRVIWTSSADRGLHLLLQEWSKIKASVPEAHLRVFYNFNFEHLLGIEPNAPGHHPVMLEMANRARYMKEMMKKLAPLGVEMVGSISRERMQQEMSEAMVLAYPVSTLTFTEGFSISIMEACASGTMPVISDCDCLGSIYGGTVPMVKSPAGKHMNEFTDLVIKGLTDKVFHDEAVAKCKEFASNYEWSKIALELEKLLKV